MNTKKRLILTLVIGSSLASPAFAAKDGVVGQTQGALNFLCEVTTLFALPTTACNVKEAIETAVTMADSVRGTLDSVRKHTIPQAVQTTLQSITGGNAGLTDSVRDTITGILEERDISALGRGADQIKQSIDALFSDQAAKQLERLRSGGSAAAGASAAANSSANLISSNAASQGMVLGESARQAGLAKEIVDTVVNAEKSQRIAQSMSDDESGKKLLKTAKDAAEKSVQRAQTAVSSRAALQVVGEQLGFMMEQSASQHLHLTQLLANQAQLSTLSTQQLTTIARLELAKQQSASAGAAQDFKQLIGEAQGYPTYVEDTFKGWGDTLTAAGNPGALALGSPKE